MGWSKILSQGCRVQSEVSGSGPERFGLCFLGLGGFRGSARWALAQCLKPVGWLSTPMMCQMVLNRERLSPAPPEKKLSQNALWSLLREESCRRLDVGTCTAKPEGPLNPQRAEAIFRMTAESAQCLNPVWGLGFGVSGFGVQASFTVVLTD